MESLTLCASAEVANRIDPNGDMRRAGTLNLNAVPIATSHDGEGNEWTPKDASTSFRICALRHRLYRREASPTYWGGYRIQYVSLCNTRLVREWLAR